MGFYRTPASIFLTVVTTHNSFLKILGYYCPPARPIAPIYRGDRAKIAKMMQIKDICDCRFTRVFTLYPDKVNPWNFHTVTKM